MKRARMRRRALRHRYGHTLQKPLLTRLNRARKVKVDPSTVEGTVLRYAAGFPEVSHPNDYTWYMIRRVPIELLDPPSRESYAEQDPDLDEEEAEESVEQNLDRYDDLARVLIREGQRPWPVVLDARGMVLDGFHRLAVLSDHGKKHVDVLWVLPKGAT